MGTTIRNAVANIETAAPPELSPKAVIRDILATNAGAIANSLPRSFDSERFRRLLLTAANTNPELFACDPQSFLAAGVAAAQLGLEPNDARGLAYLLPFNDQKRGKIVQLIVGYRGMMDLARRSGMVTAINAFAVFEGDHFDYRLGLDPTIEHVPNGPHPDEWPFLTHVYATAKIGGDAQFVVLTRRQIDKTKAKGGKSAYSPWNTYPIEMALKTAIRRLCKFLPQTVEIAQALEHEERPLSLGDLGHISVSYDETIEVDADVLQVDANGEIAAPDPMPTAGGDQ